MRDHHFPVLIFGGRDFHDQRQFAAVCQRLHDKMTFTEVIEGEAPGADQMARNWGQMNGIPAYPFFADWNLFGDRAGNMRNARMLREGRPSLCIGFPGGEGTRDMTKRILQAGVPLISGQWSDGANSPIKWTSINLQALKVHGN